jgi:prevent-host-death family protein
MYDTYMTIRIAIARFRERLGEMLRKADQGHTIVLTSRGRPRVEVRAVAPNSPAEEGLAGILPAIPAKHRPPRPARSFDMRGQPLKDLFEERARERR